MKLYFLINPFLSLFKTVRLCSLSILCATVVHCFAASAVLNNMEIAGGPQGLAFTLTADAAFSATITQKPGLKNNMSLVSLRCQKVIYGLDDFTFTDFPENCPVRKIAVSESHAPGSFEIVMAISMPLPDIQTRQKNGKCIVLLTKNPCDPFSWTAHTQKAPALGQLSSAPQPVTQANGQARLMDVSMLVRDRVEQYTFSFDKPTAIRLKREPDRIVVLFVNSTSDIGVSKLAVPGSNIAAIEIKQIAHGGTMWLGASIYVKKSAMAGVLLQAFSDKLLIYAPCDSLPRISTWSAKKGNGPIFRFAQMPKLNVDYRGMEQKANEDIKSTVNNASVFTPREETQKKTVKDSRPVAESNEAAVLTQPRPLNADEIASKEQHTISRIIIAKSNVNMRMGPSSKDSIIERLPKGVLASLLAKQGQWLKIATSAQNGWVLASMVTDSTAASPDLLESMAQFQAKQLAKAAGQQRAAQMALEKEKLIADQKAQKQKLLEEQLAKKEAERIAKEKMKAEALAKKKADDEARARAALDSAQHYAALVKDSIERAKRYSGPKTVVYHVYGRDPFLPLSHDIDSPVPMVENLNVVGILYDQVDRIGLFEDKQDKTRAYALRENDPVQNGYVLRVQPDKVLFLLNEYGISRTYALKLTKEKQ